MADRKPPSRKTPTAAPPATGELTTEQQGSAKQSMAGPSVRGTPHPCRSLLERIGTALGSGTGSDDPTVRSAAAESRLAARLDATAKRAAAMLDNANKASEYAIGGRWSAPPPKGTITESNQSPKTGDAATPPKT